MTRKMRMSGQRRSSGLNRGLHTKDYGDTIAGLEVIMSILLDYQK